jgi:hypothetical protein
LSLSRWDGARYFAQPPRYFGDVRYLYLFRVKNVNPVQKMIPTSSPQDDVDLGDDILGKLDMVADEGKQLAQGLDLAAGAVRFGFGLADRLEH